MNIDPTTTKYMIQARMEAEGIVEKPDVVGAVFGQTEGLLGEELDPVLNASSKYVEDGLKKQLANDHAPENYRIATVRNIDAWYDAFDVQPGQQLYAQY